MDWREYLSRVKYFPEGKPQIRNSVLSLLLTLPRRCGSTLMTGMRILTLYIQNSTDTPICSRFTLACSYERCTLLCYDPAKTVILLSLNLCYFCQHRQARGYISCPKPSSYHQVISRHGHIKQKRFKARRRISRIVPDTSIK